MSGFEAVAADIKAAGGQIEAAGAGVKGADPSGDIGGVSGALPGSQSSGAAGKLASTWQKRFSGWKDDADAQGERMTTSAAEYDASDYRSDQQLRILMHRTGETL
ncbi:hypothetical protein [Nocardioides aurantiacus]|uniref:hypothetical protein n=1 Tax=Nocardioides aurantiacus TaxID=86796 RepID=UPI00403F542C